VGHGRAKTSLRARGAPQTYGINVRLTNACQSLLVTLRWWCSDALLRPSAAWALSLAWVSLTTDATTCAKMAPHWESYSLPLAGRAPPRQAAPA
jgi:hypothetical protein